MEEKYIKFYQNFHKAFDGKSNHYSHLLRHSGVDSYVNVFETTTLFLEFSIEFESNDLTYHQPYSKKQQITYDLIKHLHEVEGLGYRRISQSLNRWGISGRVGTFEFGG